jgi:acetyl esterase/lipase
MRLLTILILLWTLGTACKKSDSSPNPPVQDPVKADTLLNTGYGSDPRQKMDIYLPANRSITSTKVLFLIHGGGWTEGDKVDFTGSITGLQALLPDYAIVNINYRLAAANQNLFPTQEDDVKAAAQYIFDHRNNYTVSDSWVFLGASAGAHLALLQSYKYSTPVKPKAVVSFFGPIDLDALYSSNAAAANILAAVTGSTPAANAALYQQSSPISFATAQSPPTILLQGGADPLVPPSQAVLLRDRLNALGVANQYVFYPNNGHGWGGDDLQDSILKIVAFLHQYVH